MGDCEDERACTSLICWGSGEFGQHCHGNSQDVAFEAGTVPLFQSSLWSDQVKLVSCGASHTVVVTNSSDLYVWGNGNSGQLGCGTSETKWQAEKVDLSTLCHSPVHIEGISCGGRHTVLWMKDGRVVGFGNNSYAQLGYMSDTSSKENQFTPRLLDFLSKSVISAACGDKHTVFLMSDGSVACLGNNHHGQIGSEGQKEATLPRLVDLDEPIKQVAAGANHSLALSVSGKVYIWGYGKAFGRSAGDILQPEKLAVPCPVYQVSAGSTFSVLVTGDVFTWGEGSDGQLGHGESVISLVQPTLLPCDWLRGRVKGVACGECLTAVVTDKSELYMWGRNSHTINPELPSGSNTYKPVRITSDDMTVIAVSCGAWHASVILDISVSDIKDKPPITAPVTSKAIDVAKSPEQNPQADHTEISESSATTSYDPPDVSPDSQQVEVEEAVDNCRLSETNNFPENTDFESCANLGESPWPPISEGPQKDVVLPEGRSVSGNPALNKPQRTVLPKLHIGISQNVTLSLETVEEKPSGMFPLLTTCSEFPENLPASGNDDAHISEKPGANEKKDDLAISTASAMTNFPKHRESSFRRNLTFYPEGNPYTANANKSAPFYPEPHPYSIHVSKSTAAKFALPKENTFISSKTMGFIPLEQLAESVTWSKDTETDAFTWVSKHNSSNIESNYVPKGHFPARLTRFSSAKKFSPEKFGVRHGLSRHHTTLGLKPTGSNKFKNHRLKQKAESPERPTGKLSAQWTESLSDVSSSLNSVNSSVKHFTRQQIANREWDRKNNWGRGYIFSELKPLERNIRNVSNLKSDYKTLSNARHKRKTEPSMKTALFENVTREDPSKLGEAFATRQQTFILHSTNRRH